MKTHIQHKNKIRYFLLVCIVFISTALQAQYSKKTIDSLEMRAKSSSISDEDLYDTYNTLFDAYHVDTEKALEYAWKGIRLAKKNKHYFQLANFYCKAGSAHADSGNIDSAYYYNEQTEIMIEKARHQSDANKEKLDKVEAELLQSRGVSYYFSKQYDLTLDCFLKALNISEKINDSLLTAVLYMYIGELYITTLNFQKAEVYLWKSEKIFRKLGDSQRLVDVYSRLSNVYVNKEEYPKALEYAEESLRILSTIQGEVGAAYRMAPVMQLADIYIHGFEDYEKGLKYALKTLEYAEESKNPERIATASEMLAKSYMYLKRYKESEEAAFRGLSILDTTNLHTSGYLYLYIAEANIWLKNSAKASKYFQKTVYALCDYIEQTFQTSFSEMEVKYETEKKEREIERQQNIIARRNLERGILLGGVAISAVVLILLTVLLRLRKRNNRILTEMNATKDKFFTIISHDLKNPAIAQRDAIQRLLKNTNTWTTDELTEFCIDLLKSADEEVELLYTLLSWAQIQTGRMSFTPVTFDLPAQLHTDISLIRKMAEYKKITLTDNMPNHALITGDINMLVTVVRNLLTNAVKFTPVGGEILLTVAPAANGKHTVSVTDTGTGMTQEQIQNLFNIDKMQNRTGTIGEQGTGLGLIVCKDLLAKHKSTLHVESEEGKGSRFWFFL